MHPLQPRAPHPHQCAHAAETLIMQIVISSCDVCCNDKSCCCGLRAWHTTNHALARSEVEQTMPSDVCALFANCMLQAAVIPLHAAAVHAGAVGAWCASRRLPTELQLPSTNVHVCTRRRHHRCEHNSTHTPSNQANHTLTESILKALSNASISTVKFLLVVKILDFLDSYVDFCPAQK